MKELLQNSQPILLGLAERIRALTVQLQAAADSKQPRGLGLLSSVVIDREIGSWARFKNRRQVGSYTGLCPGQYSSGNSRLQSCVTKHGNPRLRAALVEAAWRLVRFQPDYRALKNGDTCWQREHWPRALHVRKQSSPWPDSWPWTCGESVPADSLPKN